MAGISDKALKTPYAENKYRFNSGNELQNREFSDGSGLETYDANFRMYDPQIGRFWQIDPLVDISENYSPYSFANDDPILLNDPLGADTTCPGCMQEVIVTPPPTPPSSSVTTGLANTNGGDPDVAGAAGAAPTSTSDPIGGGASSTGNEDNPIKHDLDNELGKNPIYNLEHDIVETPSRWQRFINGPMYQGKNVFGEDVYMKYYGGPITGAITGLNVEGEAEGAYTVFQNISKRIRALSTTNFFIGITAAKFEANLAKVAGKAWETSRDGKVKTLIYNGIKYISRLSTEGEPTIDLYRGEELLQKYRLQK